MEENTLNIEELVYAIKKRFKLIAIITLGFTLLGFLVANYGMETKYKVTAKVFAGKTEEVQAYYSSSEIKDYKELLNTYVEIVNTDDFLSNTLSNYGIGKSVGEVKNNLSFTQLSSAPILEISYTSTNEAEAMGIVTAISNEFGTEVQSLILNTHIKVIEGAKSTTIVPNKTKTILIAFMAGLIFALGIVFILDYLDKSVKNRDQLEKILNMPVIGEIPTHVS